MSSFGKKIITFLNSNKYVLSLITIAILSHIEWFNPYSIVDWGDWGNIHTEVGKDLRRSYGTWIGYEAIGYPNIQIYFVIIRSFWYLITNMGFDIQIAYKLNLLIPIVLSGFISPYFLSKYIVNNKLIGFVCSLFYGTTTYFLSLQTGHLPIAFVYSITPLILLSFMHAVNKNSLLNWIIFAILYSIGVGYELRIMYLVSLILVTYFIFFQIKYVKKYIIHLLVAGALVLLLNSYWILPTILGQFADSISDIAGRELFGGHLVSILRSFTLYHYAWTGSFRAEGFVPQTIKLHFWILPIFITSILVLSDNKRNRTLLFFLTIALIGIFLSKQTGLPFQGVYEFMRDNIPGFQLFRESTKLYLLVVVGYLGVMAYGLKTLYKKNRKIFYIFISIFIFLFLLNLKPLITKEYGTFFVPRKMPLAYKEFNEYIYKNDSEYRVLWIPNDSRWATYSIENPKVGMIGLLNGPWNDFFTTTNTSYSRGKHIVSFLHTDEGRKVLNNLSVKYIAIPLEDDSDLERRLFDYSGESRQYFSNELRKVNYLNKDNRFELDVYENSTFYPRIFLTDEKNLMSDQLKITQTKFEVISSSQYDVVLTQISEPVYLNFSESYHPSWAIKVGEFNWRSALFNRDYFMRNSHFENNIKLNSFIIDPHKICREYDCVRNNDGSYDLRITLFYKPQMYLYLGGIISIATLFGLIVYFIFVGSKLFFGRKK